MMGGAVSIEKDAAAIAASFSLDLVGQRFRQQAVDPTPVEFGRQVPQHRLCQMGPVDLVEPLVEPEGAAN